MSAAAYLPPIPQPPHDPRYMLLNARAGWQQQSSASSPHVVFRPSDGALMLAMLPGVARSLAEPSGSLGGLVPPSNVAVGEDGSIFLLDPSSLYLKRFDPCCCKFVTVPCLGGKGSRLRQIAGPGGIAIHAGNLYICDPENRRVQIFSLRGLVLRSIWSNPASAHLPNPWAPRAIAFGRHGHAYVADPDNLGVHRFDRSGRWEAFFGSLGVTRAVAVDCAGRVYVVIDGQSEVTILKPDGEFVDAASDPGQVAASFPALPFSVDAAGTLSLGQLCEPPAMPTPAPTGPPFYTDGASVSNALDSSLYRCQWHRVVLRGAIPRGTQVTIQTYTAEAELPDEQILDANLAWQTNQVFNAIPSGETDCLVSNKGGRYLWLRLVLRGDGWQSPVLREVQLDFPRVSLRRYLPAVFGEETAGADFTDRFLSIFDTTLRSIECTIDNQATLFDPRSTPATPDPKTGVDFLSWLASWIGVSLQRSWPEARRREWLRRAGSFFCARGTTEGLRRELLFFLGMDADHHQCKSCEPKKICCPKPPNCAPRKKDCPCQWAPPPLILEHFKLRRWLFLGTARIGNDAVLWGSRIVNRSQLNENAQTGVTKLIGTQDPLRDPFHFYAHKFSVFVPACFGASDTARRSLMNLLESERPAHTQYQLEFVEPRFRIGTQSMIGFDSVIGLPPKGSRLEEMTLGKSSVLQQRVGGPSFEIGRQARIGSTTGLD
jgi:phage tail-like protein